MKYSAALCVLAVSWNLVACGGDDAAGGATLADVGGPADVVERQDSAPDDTGPDCSANPGAPGCKAAELCSPCKADGDCGGEKVRCLPDARGEGFCSTRCDYIGKDVCPEGYHCKQTGTTTQDFYCHPLDGVCSADGLDCAPCAPATADCAQGLQCIQLLGGIHACLRDCAASSTCPSAKMGCGHIEGLAGSFCLPIVAGEPAAKCGAIPLGFCETCESPGQCATGVCEYTMEIGQVCGIPCQSKANCPTGTFCPQGYCLPPIVYGCQGYLSCLGVDCPEGQLCYRGMCIDPP